MKALGLMLLFIISFAAKGQDYYTLYVIPLNPNPTDTIKVYIKLSFGNEFNTRLSSDVQFSNDTVYIKNCFYYWGNSTGVSFRTDTTTIGSLTYGIYTISYTANITMDTFNTTCANPQFHPDFDTTFTVHPAIGIKEGKADNFQISPNPTPTNFTLQLSSIPTNTTLNLYNTIGAIVLQQAIQQQTTQIDVSTLPKGIYIAEVQTPQGSGVKKLVVE